ncbi:MAG: VOC family protein [Myxococcota bacterium]
MTESFIRVCENPATRASAIAYVMFARPSLERTERFLRDFGIARLSGDAEWACFGSAERQEVFYVVRRGPEPKFAGLGVYVDSEDDLHALIAEGFASAVEPDPAPNGQPFVRLADPNGVEVHAVVRSPNAVSSLRPAAPTNGALRVDRPLVSEGSVPPVLRLGHVVMETTDFEETVAWYQRAFGMIVSDYQHLPDGTPVVAFCRYDRGETPTDHHSIAIGRGFRRGFEHVAFEVADIEAVTRGQHVLRKRGWKHSWGIGRHIMGSQIFDYWYDEYGAKHEHYADGDLVTSSFPMGRSPFGPSFLAQWGPPMPGTFIGGAPSLRLLVDLVQFAASRKMSLRRLAALIKAAKFSNTRIGPPVEKGDGTRAAS